VFALLYFALPHAPRCGAVTYEVGVRLSDDDFSRDLERVKASLTALNFDPRLCV
jgi:hypothetical protein